MDTNQYLDIFIDESREHLQNLNDQMLQLENNTDDIGILNEIFRSAHTLKGMAGTMSFNKMSVLTHDMENVLQALRNREIKVTSDLIDVLFKCLDALGYYIDNIVNTGSEGDNEFTDIIEELRNALGGNDGSGGSGKAKAEKASEKASDSSSSQDKKLIAINQYEQNVINKALDDGLKALQIDIALNKGCMLKSARAFIIFQVLERNGEVIKSVPSVEDIEDEKFDFEFSVVFLTDKSPELINKELNQISEVESVIINEVGAKPVEKLKEAATGAQVTTKTPEPGNNVKSGTSHGDNGTASKVNKAGKTVRVDITRLDLLMNLVSELIIQKTRLEDIGSQRDSNAYHEALESLERITTDLHDAVMKVRMVPVESVFNRFPRMIRDISRELGKDINLVMSGEETELDRTVIDEIGDPLIHLLRNSADHGIEPVEEREKAGKPRTGQISLKAYQDGNSVVIEVADDGRGIDIEKVRKKLVEKGMVSKELAGSLSKNEIIEYLFRPSFSTADKVTDLSGRVVGLDVVKTKIESLGGNVEVETETGKGSRFIIRLPLTLAIIQALMIVVGNEKYAIPLNNIKEIVRVPVDEIKQVQNQEVFLLRNNLIPVIWLNKVLGVTSDEKSKKYLTVVIVKKGEKLSGLVVDSLIGQQEIVQKSLGKLLSGIKLLAGATILGDGSVALILDVNSMI